MNCAPISTESHEVSKDSFTWYTKNSAAVVASVPQWLEETKRELGSHEYLLLLCLLDLHDVPHDKCMQSIELIGKYVIPEFAG